MLPRANHFRPAAPPFLIRRTPRRPTVRRAAERAWSVYPPAAILLAALVVAGGCRTNDHDDYAAGDRRDAARLAVAEETGVLESGDAERQEMLVDAGETLPAKPAAPAFAAYPSELPLVGSAAARATVRYGKDELAVTNLSKAPWREATVWVNRAYGARVGLTKPGETLTIDFARFRDHAGRTFPSNNKRVRVEEVELVIGDERTRVRFGLDY